MNFIEKNMPFKTIFLNNFYQKMIKKILQVFKQFTGIVFQIMIVITIYLVCLQYPSQAVELPPIDDVVSSLQRTYEKTIDFKADFIQETTIKSIKKIDVEEGHVFFKNPRNMLWNYTKPKAKKLVINSKKAWLYLPQEKVAYTQDSDYIFQSKVLIKFLSGLGKLKDDFTIEYARPNALDKSGNYILVLIPLEKSTAYNTLQIHVDKNSFYILQVNFDDVLGNYTTLRFSNIAMNTGLDHKIFQFQPPAGVSIFKMP
jgi:outer membrane lipoprotein carrier protein